MCPHTSLPTTLFLVNMVHTAVVILLPRSVCDCLLVLLLDPHRPGHREDDLVSDDTLGARQYFQQHHYQHTQGRVSDCFRGLDDCKYSICLRGTCGVSRQHFLQIKIRESFLARAT